MSMSTKDKIEEIISHVVDICDNFDNGRIDMNDAMYKLLERRYILQHMIEEQNYDNLLCVPQTMYAIDMTMAEMLKDEAEAIDEAVNGKISLNDIDFTWKKEGGK